MLAQRALALAEARDAAYEVGWAPILLARSYSRRGDNDAALGWFERALASSDPDESFELGLELASHAASSRSGSDRAMRVYERLREDRPADRRLWGPAPPACAWWIRYTPARVHGGCSAPARAPAS